MPNLYAPDPAVQVSYNSSSQSPDSNLTKRIETILADGDSETRIETTDDYVLIRTGSSDDQLKVKSALSNNLGGDVIVALNLAPTTPQWLSNIGAEPMKLGLDLRGGVHFLMEVDTAAAIKNRQNGTLQDIKRRLREEKIRYSGAFVEEDLSISVKFQSEAVFSEAKDFIEDNYSQFLGSPDSKEPLTISLVLAELEIDQIKSDAIDQNLTTLRNRVNELGVSEPIVQRQGKTRIVVQLPGIQDTAEAKKILGKTATLEFHLEAQLDTPRTRKTNYPFKGQQGPGADLQDAVILGGDQVATAQASFDENGLPQVNITLDGQGGGRMHRATRGSIGKRLGVLFVEQKTRTKYQIDDSGKQVPVLETYEIKEIISLATIRAALGTTFRITGLDSPSESSELALLLRAGALAAPMRFVEERTVGPSLGADNIDAGILSMELGMALVLAELEIDQIKSDAIDQNLTTLRNRVNELGVSEPIVQRQGKTRIVVQLPGIQDTAEAKKILGKTATLEFHLEAQLDTPRTRKTNYPFKGQQGPGAELQDAVILGGDQVATAQASFDENGLPQVNITLDGQGGGRMHRATRGSIGKRLGVLFVEQKTRTKYQIDDSGKQVPVLETYEIKEIISLATIRAALGTTFRITGLDSPSESSELALLLRAGALAAPMRFVEERTVGPSLGADNIDAGILSMELGMALVLLFILIYYRVFGIAASLALSFNIILLIAVMSILSATLTLPGIAGIVLTVGMAVDANVLIFSRIREELARGRKPLDAIDAGYDRAFLTIWDANFTTLIVAVVLYSLGTGAIKGFSITLMIGIITSMFTAIMGTRAFINLVYGSKKDLSRLSI